MSASAVFRALDGTTIPELMTKTVDRLDEASKGCVRESGIWARKVIVAAGQPFYIRARRTRKPVHLNARLAQHFVQGTPPGFWAIVNEGSTKTWRIERKLLGRGRNRRAQLLSTPYGPRPYVIRKGQRPVGHPWETAMAEVERMPQEILDPTIVSAFKDVWR
jgi:hypothetical protein